MQNENLAVHPDTREELPEILMRIVSELHDVAYLIERVEPHLLELGGPKILEHPDSLKVLQGIDLAVQPAVGRKKRMLIADMDSTMIQQELTALETFWQFFANCLFNNPWAGKTNQRLGLTNIDIA